MWVMWWCLLSLYPVLASYQNIRGAAWKSSFILIWYQSLVIDQKKIMVESYFFISVSVRGHFSILNLWERKFLRYRPRYQNTGGDWKFIYSIYSLFTWSKNHRIFFLQIFLHFRPDEDSWRVTEFVSKKMDSSILLSNFFVLLRIWLLI